MSTIVALQSWPDGKETVLASDTQVSAGSRKWTSERGKWVVRNQWAIGASGYSRLQDLLERSEWRGDSQTAGDVADMVRKLVVDDGWEFGSDTGPRSVNGSMILVRRGGGMWEIDGSFSSDPVPARKGWLYAACGSGGELALGALDALVREDRVSLSPAGCAKLAVETANRYCTESSGVYVRTSWHGTC